MIFDALTIGKLKAEIKDLPDDMPVYLDDEHEFMGLLSIQQRKLTTYDLHEDKETEIEALVLWIA